MIAERIRAFAATDASLAELQIREVDLGTAIIAGELSIVTVVEADAAPQGVTRQQLATVYRARIAEAVEAYRAERTTSELIRDAVYSAIATVLLIAAILVIRWLFRRVMAALEARHRERIASLEVHGFPIVTAEQVWAIARGGIRGARLIGILTAAYIYVDIVLGRFPWTRAAGESMTEMVVAPLVVIGSGIVSSIPDLFFLAVLALVARYVIKLGRVFFQALADERVSFQNFDSDWAWPTYRIARTLIIIFAVVAAYPYIPGSDSAAFKGISVFLGVILSLGSSTVIANIMAGYSMTYRRAFREGDRIRVDDTVGDVLKTRLLVTHVRSLKNEEVVIPNSVLLNSEVINYTTMARENGVILHTQVGIGYEVPWRQVEEMLRIAADRTGRLEKEPQPFVLQTSLTDFAVVYEINAYCRDAYSMPAIYADLHRNILDVFNEHGVQIMTPNYEYDPEEPKLVPKDQWYASPAEKNATVPPSSDAA
jgi:small-conductance mechanosensitive channel